MLKFCFTLLRSTTATHLEPFTGFASVGVPTKTTTTAITTAAAVLEDEVKKQQKLVKRKEEKAEKKAAAKAEEKAAVKATRPKRPINAFNVFTQEKLPLRPADMKVTHYFQEVSAQFKKLSPAEKEVYELKAYPDKERYAAELEAWKAQYLKDHPKRPKSAYLLFVQHRMPDRPKDMEMTEFIKQIAKEYHALSPAEVDKFVAASQKEKEQYNLVKPVTKKVKKPRMRAPNGYNMFVKKIMADRTKGEQPKEAITKAAELWGTLDPKEKAKYIVLAEGEAAKFKHPAKVKKTKDATKKPGEKTKKKAAKVEKKNGGESSDDEKTKKSKPKAKTTEKKDQSGSVNVEHSKKG